MERILESGVLVPYLSPFENFIVSLTCRSALCMRPNIIAENKGEKYRSRQLITIDGRKEWLSAKLTYAAYISIFNPEIYSSFDRPQGVEVIVILREDGSRVLMRGFKYSAVYDERRKQRKILTDFGTKCEPIRKYMRLTEPYTVCVREDGIRIYNDLLDYIINREVDVTMGRLCYGFRRLPIIYPLDLIPNPDSDRLPIEYKSNSFVVRISKAKDVYRLLQDRVYIDSYAGYREYNILPYCGSEYFKVRYNSSYIEGQNTDPYELNDDAPTDTQLKDTYTLVISRKNIQLKDTYTLGISWNTYRYSYGGEYSIRSMKISKDHTTMRFVRAKLFDTRLFCIDIHNSFDIENIGDYYYVVCKSKCKYVRSDIYAPKGLCKIAKGEYSRYYILE